MKFNSNIYVTRITCKASPQLLRAWNRFHMEWDQTKLNDINRRKEGKAVHSYWKCE